MKSTFYNIELIRDNVFFLQFVKGVKIDLETIEQMVREGETLVNNKPHHVIADASSVNNTLSNEARNFLKEHERNNKIKLSQSMISKSFTKSVMIGIYLRFTNQNVPTKIFSKIEDALDWIDNLELQKT